MLANMLKSSLTKFASQLKSRDLETFTLASANARRGKISLDQAPAQDQPAVAEFCKLDR